jgi:hypothetical protein
MAFKYKGIYMSDCMSGYYKINWKNLCDTTVSCMIDSGWVSETSDS